MVKMATINYKFSSSLTLALNSTHEINPHFPTTLKFPILNAFLFSMLTSTFVFNKALRSFTLASKLLMIMAKFLNYDYNISNLDINFSTNVPEMQ